MAVLSHDIFFFHSRTKNKLYSSNPIHFLYFFIFLFTRDSLHSTLSKRLPFTKQSAQFLCTHILITIEL